jgi:hypothetical protein
MNMKIIVGVLEGESSRRWEVENMITCLELRGERGRGWAGGKMTQTIYAHVNK